MNDVVAAVAVVVAAVTGGRSFERDIAQPAASDGGSYNSGG